jgi:hypothetical protein
VTKDERDYLRSLVRMDIRKKERGLASFVPRLGQSHAEAAEVRAKLERSLEFRRGVLEMLTTAEVVEIPQ